MTSVTPLHSQETVAGGLRNALWIAQLGVDAIHHIDHEQDAASHFEDIVRLLKNVLEALSEPNAATLNVTASLLRAAMGPTAFDLAEPRLPRDTAAVILNAQVTGYSPETL